MAGRGRKRSSKGIGALGLLIVGLIGTAVKAITEFVSENMELFLILGIFIIVFIAGILITKIIIHRQRNELLTEILRELHLENIDDQLTEYDDQIIVKSRQTLDNYSDLKYFKDTGNFQSVQKEAETRKNINRCLHSFLQGNDFENRPQYGYIKNN